MGAAFLGNLAQLQRSWYMFFFQHALSDFLVSANNFAFIDMLWAQWSPGFDATTDLAHVKASLTDPANLQAALGYYRATLGAGYKDPDLKEAQALAQSETPTQPVLYLHGRNDGCIGAEVGDYAASNAPANARVEFVENAGHFMQLEQPTAVNKIIIDWVTGRAA
jgi:pimeloyl-ACP methyl ester carboxylesterase